jgi:flavin-dependent dehydrogenase
MLSRYDVLVVGAGPAGASLTLQLVGAGYRCLMVDKHASPSRTLGEALKPVGRALLQELGLELDLRRLGAAPTFVTRVSWAGRTFEKVHVNASLGPELHVDRARFDAWLQHAAQAAGAELCAPARVRALHRSGAGYRARLRVGERDVDIEAAYVVDASGRHASLSRKLGAVRASADDLVGYSRWYDARQVAPLVLIEAASEGWWYSAPTPPDDVEPSAWNPKATREHGKLVVLFVTDPRSASRHERWEQLLCEAPATRERLAGAAQDGAPRSYVAAPALTTWTPGQRWLPIGDAALSFDPIAADGLCFALRSALEAAAHIDAELRGRAPSNAYGAAIARIYQEHLSRRLGHYRDEAVAHGKPFWRRRLEPLRKAESEGIARDEQALLRR